MRSRRLARCEHGSRVRRGTRTRDNAIHGGTMEPSRVQLDATTSPDGLAIVRLVGELDVADAEAVRRILTAEARSSMFVAVDLAGLSFIDIAGVRALDAAQQAANQCGSRLVLVSPPRCVSMLVGLMGFGHMRFADDRS